MSSASFYLQRPTSAPAPPTSRLGSTRRKKLRTTETIDVAPARGLAASNPNGYKIIREKRGGSGQCGLARRRVLASESPVWVIVSREPSIKPSERDGVCNPSRTFIPTPTIDTSRQAPRNLPEKGARLVGHSLDYSHPRFFPALHLLGWRRATKVSVRHAPLSAVARWWWWSVPARNAHRLAKRANR